MASYCWELGVDWNAVEGATGSGYLQNGFVLEGTAPAMASPVGLGLGDTVAFRVFDVTGAEPGVKEVFLSLTSRAAVAGQLQSRTLRSEQPTVAGTGMRPSVTFRGNFPCWESAAMPIDHTGKFLLTFTVRATDGVVDRTFVVDPEMVVGEDGPVAPQGGDEAAGSRTNMR
jgi:hypothetical protein